MNWNRKSKTMFTEIRVNRGRQSISQTDSQTDKKKWWWKFFFLFTPNLRFFLSFWVHKEKDQKLFLPSILKRCFMDNLPLFIIINPGLAGIRIEIYWPKANFSNFDLKTNRLSVSVSVTLYLYLQCEINWSNARSSLVILI